MYNVSANCLSVVFVLKFLIPTETQKEPLSANCTDEIVVFGLYHICGTGVISLMWMQTRMHSSRMRTVRSQNIRGGCLLLGGGEVPAFGGDHVTYPIMHLMLPVCCLHTNWERNKTTFPKVNKFEQVSSDGHQMSLAEGDHVGVGGGYGVLRSYVVVTWGSPSGQTWLET